MSLLLSSLKKADEENKVKSASEVSKPASDSLSGAGGGIDFDAIADDNQEPSTSPISAEKNLVGAAKVFRAGGGRPDIESGSGGSKVLVSVAMAVIVIVGGGYFLLSNNLISIIGGNVNDLLGSSDRVTSNNIAQPIAEPKLKGAVSEEVGGKLPRPRVDVQAEIDFAALKAPRLDDLSTKEEREKYVEKIAILTGYNPRMPAISKQEETVTNNEEDSITDEGITEEIDTVVNAELSRSRKKKLDALTSYESVLGKGVKIHSDGEDSFLDNQVAQAQVSSDKQKGSASAIDVMSSMDGVERSRLLGQAQSFYMSGSYAEAEALYRQVLVKNPTNIDALRGLALVAVASGRYQLAIATYLQILNYYPSDPVAFADLTNLHDMSGQDIYELEFAIKRNIGKRPIWDSRLYFSLGNLYSSHGRWLDAQEAYFEAHSRDQNNPDYSYNLAVVFDYLNKPQLAIQYYELALKLSEQSVSGFDVNQVRVRINKLRK